MIKLKNILLEKKELDSKKIAEIEKLTKRNNHTTARQYLAYWSGNEKLRTYYLAMAQLLDVFNGYGPELTRLNKKMEKELYRHLVRTYKNYDEIYNAL